MRIVLIEPLYPRNIGATLRVCANFDVKELILVNPQCETNLNKEFHESVAGAQEYLEQMIALQSWDEFNERYTSGTRIGFTARKRKRIPLSEFNAGFVKENLPEDAFLIFGREDSGLSDDDLQNCHLSCKLPTPDTMNSLNLSQAVLMALYICHQNSQESMSTPTAQNLPYSVVSEWLSALGFKSEEQNWSATKALHQMLMRSCPSEQEVQLIQKIAHQSIRKMSQTETD